MNDIIFKNSQLTKDNYHRGEHKKTQIVVGNSYSTNMSHLTKWKTRLNGKYKKTAAYSITLDGTIHLHYNPKYYSEFIGIDGVDRHIIPVVLENEGWLMKDINQNKFVDWIGDIYNRDSEPIKSRWRGHEYWAPYTEAQENALVQLCEYLCTRFNIKRQTLKHNTKVESIDNFSGVVFRANYDKFFSDISPAFDFLRFKNKLELK